MVTTPDPGDGVAAEPVAAVAEDAGLVPEITLAVLAATMRDLGNMLRYNDDVCININLAPEDLEGAEFGNALAESLELAGLAPQKIKLEITERAVMDSDKSRQIIHDFRNRGHKVAIDDFGTGYSSLSYLETFELDSLKIDKSFVDAIGMDAVTSNVIGHIIEMSKSLDLETVAEGIETSQQMTWLQAQGVELGQGFLFSEPLPAAQFRQYFRAQIYSNVHPIYQRTSNRAVS